MPGIGFKNALSLYCKHGSAHKVIDSWYEDVLRHFQKGKKTRQMNSKSNGKKGSANAASLSMRFDNEDEFNIQESDMEWSDGDEESMLNAKFNGHSDNKRGTGANSETNEKTARRIKSKYSAFDSIEECVQYFTNYHTDYDETVISYLYQHVIDPLRCRFTSVNDLFRFNDLLSPTLSTTSPISPQLSFLSFSQQQRALQQSALNDHLHAKTTHAHPTPCPHQLPITPTRSQSTLYPMLSYSL